MGGSRLLKGIVFDLDGTLTVPNLDFAEMYDRCGVAYGEDILAAIEEMPEVRKRESEEIIEEMEEEGRRTLQLMPGARDVGLWSCQKNLRLGLVTRNTRRTVDHFTSSLWRDLPAFEPSVSRDSSFPPKPDPAAFLHIAQAWGCSPDEMVMVGDSQQNDVVFGKRAGATTVLLANSGDADFVIQNLADLPTVLEEHFIFASNSPEET